jgi:hypothetical protein
LIFTNGVLNTLKKNYKPNQRNYQNLKIFHHGHIKYAMAQHSDGEWYFYEETPTMIKFKDGSGGAWKQDGNQIYSGVKTDTFKDWDKITAYICICILYNVKNG